MGKKAKKDKGDKKFGPQTEVEILDDFPMTSAYYMVHNVPGLLELRDYPWPDKPQKGKGKK